MTTLIFGQPGKGARHEWNASDFINVDDTVRGGASTSKMTVTLEVTDCDANDIGSIDFSGFLDTTTLGGAGFASQAYSRSFPGQTIGKDAFQGLRLLGRRLPSTPQSRSNSTYPGGGEGPVTSFVVNLKTVKPTRRPDGRRQSEIVYEWTIQLGNSSEKAVPEGAMFDVQASWADFHPTYRGRPASNAPTLDPAQVQEWSIMARSDFGSQSGPFNVRLIGLGAVRNRTKEAHYRRSTNDHIKVAGTSGEYYGFALFIFATVIMVVWTVWALTPDHVLRKMGIDWFPNREWAFLFPAWSLFAVLFVYAAFIGLNTYSNASLESISSVTDSHSNILPIDPSIISDEHSHPLHNLSMVQTASSRGPLTNDIYDLPPGLVSRERAGI